MVSYTLQFPSSYSGIMSSFFHLAVYCSHKPSHLPSFVFFRTICSVLHLGQRRKGSAPLSFSIPRTAIKQRLWERQLEKIHLKVRQSGKVVMSGYNTTFEAIVIHIVPNHHTGEQGMHWDKTNKGDYHSVPDPDPDIRGRGRSPKKFSQPYGPQFGLKIRAASSGSATVILNDASC